MANIKTLTISIAANISDFTKGLNKARRDLNKWAKDIPGATVGVGTAFAAASAAAAAGLVVMTEQAMASIDSIAKLSDRMGISTENLVAYRHAASLAGVSNEELTMGLEKFIKALPTGSDVGASFENVAKQIAAIKDPVAQAQAAIEVFGKSGQRLLPLLNADLGAAKSEAEKLGITFSRLEAAKVEAANDAVTRLKSALEGVGVQLAVTIAPMLEVAANRLREFLTGGDGIKSRVGSALEYVALGIAKASDFLSLFEAGWYTLQSGFTTVIQGMNFGLKVTAQGLDLLLEKMGMAATGAGAFFEELDRGLGQDALAAAQKANEAFTRFASGENEAKVRNFYETVKREADAAAAEIADKAKAKMGGGVVDLNGLIGKDDNVLGAFGMSKGVFDLAKKGIEEMDKAMEKLKETMADAADSFHEKFKTAAEKIQDEMSEFASLVFSGALQGDDLKRGLEYFQKQVEDAMGDKVEAKTAGLGRSIDLSKIALGSQGTATTREQTVKDPKQHALLAAMLEQLKQLKVDMGVGQ